MLENLIERLNKINFGENNMDKIIIKKNPNGDTRTAPKGITFEQFHEANMSHKHDVDNVMNRLGYLISVAGQEHDWTKIERPKSMTKLESIDTKYEHMFYNDFVATQEGKLNFIEGDWYKIHVNKERHHLLSHCPDDVNLIDVLEMVVDCTVAGLARSGEVRPMEINSDILMKAVENTSKMIVDICKVEN